MGEKRKLSLTACEEGKRGGFELWSEKEATEIQQDVNGVHHRKLAFKSTLAGFDETSCRRSYTTNAEYESPNLCETDHSPSAPPVGKRH